MSALFTSLELAGLTLANRVIVSPMCQYSAEDGTATDWHMAHLGQYAVSGVGLVLTEATHVSPEARITPQCLGLYSDANEAALADVIAFYRRYSATPIGLQLAHAGRKASTNMPWMGGKPLPADDPRAWTTVGPSALPHAEGWHVPQALDASGLAKVKADFVAAAKRADRLGVDVIELHMAHGYLLHQFCSPVSNQRTDAYGGSLQNRMRFPLEVFEAVRAVWPGHKPLGARITGTDYLDHLDSPSWRIDDAVAFAKALKTAGADFFDVSGGGISADQKIGTEPGYQVHLAKAVQAATGVPTMAVGLITEAEQADAIVARGDADMVAIARAFLRNPRWVWDAADKLGGEIVAPDQYLRGRHLNNAPRELVRAAR